MPRKLYKCARIECSNLIFRRKCCSLECSKIVRWGNKSINICLYESCSNEVKTGNKYCSKSCSNYHFQRKPPKKIISCLYCSIETTNPKFCSPKCSGDYKSQKIHNKALENGYFSKNGIVTIKKLIIKLHGHMCSICHLTKWQDKPVPLVLDHIDGNSENNSLINLRLVCGNCDMQLPTYKSKNLGNGRASRRQRYKEEKSY